MGPPSVRFRARPPLALRSSTLRNFPWFRRAATLSRMSPTKIDGGGNRATHQRLSQRSIVVAARSARDLRIFGELGSVPLPAGDLRPERSGGLSLPPRRRR